MVRAITGGDPDRGLELLWQEDWVQRYSGAALIGYLEGLGRNVDYRKVAGDLREIAPAMPDAGFSGADVDLIIASAWVGSATGDAMDWYFHEQGQPSDSTSSTFLIDRLVRSVPGESQDEALAWLERNRDLLVDSDRLSPESEAKWREIAAIGRF